MTDAMTEINGWYAARFGEFERTLNGESTTALHAVRRDALARFSAMGFPTTSEEEWRFTNVAPIARTRFIPAEAYAPGTVDRAFVERLSIAGAARLVFVNGFHAPELSSVPALPPGVRIGSLAQALRDDPAFVGRYLGKQATYANSAFTALGTAFLRDGALVCIDDNAALEIPVQLLFIGSGVSGPVVSSPRILVVAGNNARAAIVETYAGTGSEVYWTNAVTEISLGRDTAIEYDKVQAETPRAYHVGSTHIVLGQRSVFTSNAVAMGGSLVRNNVSAVFGGENAECTLNGL